MVALGVKVKDHQSFFTLIHPKGDIFSLSNFMANNFTAVDISLKTTYFNLLVALEEHSGK